MNDDILVEQIKMRIEILTSDLLDEKTYFVIDDNNRGILIDPGMGVVEEVNRYIKEEGVVLEGILLTHGHIDHTWSLLSLSGDRPSYIHPEDKWMLSDPVKALSPESIDFLQAVDVPIGIPDNLQLLTENTKLPLGIEVKFHPGHTKGSVVYMLKGIVFSGDSLFRLSVGRTDLVGGDYEELLKSLGRVFLPLPKSTLVYPGHGKLTVLEREFELNPHMNLAREKIDSFG